jgi:hypothetical protein
VLAILGDGDNNVVVGLAQALISTQRIKAVTDFAIWRWSGMAKIFDGCQQVT